MIKTTSDIMKFLLVLSVAAFLSIMSSCCGFQGDDLVKVVDLTLDYPQKEFIVQNFLDVEYLPLETSDEFITQGDVLAIGEKYVLIKNWLNDGNIYIFDRKTGKGIRKFNRKGQGAGEYTFINGVVLDEDKNEIFVNSAQLRKILVYDMYGNFKRELKHAENSEYLNMYKCGKDYLMCYDMSGYYDSGKIKDKESYHVVISKLDGSVESRVLIPFDVIKSPFVQEGDNVAASFVRPVVPFYDNLLVVETSTDTIYNYSIKKKELAPFLIRKSSDDPEIFLTLGAITEEYCFMQATENKYDFSKRRGFSQKVLMYDKKDDAIYIPTVLNMDYANKKIDLISNPLNEEHLVACQVLQAPQLVEAYESGELKGGLNEIASSITEEANPILLLMKRKK